MDEQNRICEYVTNLITRFSYRKIEKGFITIGGYAGTGKTTLISKILDSVGPRMNPRIGILAPTGRAALNLKRKIIDFGLNEDNYFIGTIHSLLYRPVVVDNVLVGWERKDKDEIGVDFVFVDESSMVGTEQWIDLIDNDLFIVAVGDHGQLYPIKTDLINSQTNYSVKFKVNSLQKEIFNPNFELKTIHRQLEDNPIIKLSMEVRNGKSIKNGLYGKNVFKLNWKDPVCKQIFDKINFEDQDLIMLTNTNNTRSILNDDVREKLKYSRHEPYPGEKIVCLSNNRHLGIMNGELFTVEWLMHFDKYYYDITIKSENSDLMFSVLARKDIFGSVDYSKIQKVEKLSSSTSLELRKRGGECRFDFGYAISVHKSQGSQWKKVILFEERNRYQNDDEWKRWLYTGVTRPTEKLFIIVGF